MNLFAIAVAIVAIFGLATGAFGADAPPFPFKTYADVPDPDSVGPTECEVHSQFIRVGDDWRILSSDTKDLFLLIIDGKPAFVYLTTGDSSDGIITVVSVLSLEAFRAKYPDPCTYFSDTAL